MRQIKVFRCDICHAPFLFENNLEDHKKEHAPATKDSRSASVEKTIVNKKRRKSARARQKQKST